MEKKRRLTSVGCPVGQPEFVVAELITKVEEHASLFKKITHILGVQIVVAPGVLCFHEGKLVVPDSAPPS